MQEAAKTPPNLNEKKWKRIPELSFQTLVLLEELIDKTMDYPRDEVEAIVWELTYFPENSMFVKMSEENLTQDQIVEIREEILRRYRFKNPWWSFGKKYPKKSRYKKMDSFRALKTASNNDEVTIHIAMVEIERYLSKKSVQRKKVENIIANLTSQKERSQFGGLRALSFDYEEAAFLMPCANAIGNLIKDLYQM